MKLVLCLLTLVALISKSKQSAPEQGIWHVVLDSANSNALVSKTLYNESTISITLVSTCKGDFTFSWYIRGTTCLGLPRYQANVVQLHPDIRLNDDEVAEYVSNSPVELACMEQPALSANNEWKPVTPPKKNNDTTANSRSVRDNTDSTNPAPTAKLPTTVKSSDNGVKVHDVAKTPMQGEFTVVVWITDMDVKGNVSVDIKMKTPLGYLSAHEYPLLTFYLIMCIVYVLFAVAWFVMSACNYRDLLRVQFWIGGVILLGMIENAVFYSEYQNVNSTGISVLGATKFAEIVSALKRSVARMLVIIVSLGFGIVKPRLGPMLHRVIGVGILYFVLAVVEAMIRNDAALHDSEKNKSIMFAFLPLAILDSIICWWIFVSLLQTMKTLRLRRNTTKLSLYRHFSNLIIFCVLASVVMILWSIRLHNNECVSDWSELWMDTAFWPILFSVILLVIMILWRPTANNQRYAYSPMIDGNDSDLDEMEESMLGSGATEGMKMRGPKKIDHDKDANKTEEDLKWIEENIPQTIADAALPALLDSDEEVLTTKYEMSKME